MSHSAVRIETPAHAVRTRDEPQKHATQGRGQGGHGGHGSVYRNVQSSLVHRDQPQTGIAGIPGGREVLGDHKASCGGDFKKVLELHKSDSTENTVNSADQPKATTKPY